MYETLPAFNTDIPPGSRGWLVNNASSIIIHLNLLSSDFTCMLHIIDVYDSDNDCCWPTKGAMILPTLAHIDAEPSPTLRTLTISIHIPSFDFIFQCVFSYHIAPKYKKHRAYQTILCHVFCIFFVCKTKAFGGQQASFSVSGWYVLTTVGNISAA